MWGRAYFGGRYWGAHYWGDGGELPPTPSAPVIDGAGNLDWLNKGPKKKKRKGRVIRFSDYETREAYEAELEKAAQALAAESIPVSAIAEDGSVEDDDLEDDEILLMALTRILH